MTDKIERNKLSDDGLKTTDTSNLKEQLEALSDELRGVKDFMERKVTASSGFFSQDSKKISADSDKINTFIDRADHICANLREIKQGPEQGTTGIGG